MKTIRIVSCGCCSNGCTCWIHQDTPMGRPPTVCAFHKINTHPNITGEETLYEGAGAAQRFFCEGTRNGNSR